MAALLVLLLTLAQASPAPAQASRPAATAPAGFTDGQQVEIREGDVWSAGSVVKHEGRRYQIRYGDGTEEWVTSERIRLPGSSVPPAPGQAPAAPSPAPAGKAEPVVGQAVKAKWGVSWWNAKILRKVPGPVDRWEVLYSDNTRGTVPRDEILLPGEKEPARRSPFEQKSIDYPVIEADLSGVREVIPAAGEWRPAVDPAPAAQRLSERPIVLEGGKAGFFDEASFHVSGTRAIQVVRTGGISNPGPHRVTPCDLVAGTSGAALQVVQASLPLGLNPNGQILLARANGFHSGTSRRIDLWNATGGQARHLLSFEPFNGEHWKDVTSAQFVGDNHILTRNLEGLLILWRVNTDAPQQAKALWRLKPQVGGVGLAFSPGGKYLFIRDGDGILALFAETGEPHTFIPAAGVAGPSAVTPDGKRLVNLSNNRLRVWDLTSGQLQRDVTLPPSVSGGLVAVDPQFALVGEHLVDLEKGLPVWRYAGASGKASVYGKVIFTDNPKERPAARVVTLPHPAARAAAAKLPPPPLAVREGATVSLEVSMEAPETERTQIIDAIRRQLAEGKINVADGQPIRLVVRTETGKPEERTYQRTGAFGRAASEEKVTITPKSTRVAWMKGDVALWEQVSGGAGPGFHLMLKPGQTAQQAVDEQSKVSVAWVKEARIPTQVVDITAAPPLGRSTITMNGVVDR